MAYVVDKRAGYVDMHHQHLIVKWFAPPSAEQQYELINQMLELDRSNCQEPIPELVCIDDRSPEI